MPFYSHIRELKPGVVEEDDLYLAESEFSGGLVPTRVRKIHLDGFSCESPVLTVSHRYDATSLNQGVLVKQTDDGKLELYASPVFINYLKTLFKDMDDLEEVVSRDGSLADAGPLALLMHG